MCWEPWNLYRKEAEVIELFEPPCSNCEHWKPQRRYMSTRLGFMYDGVVCCHADTMERDFSCFNFREVNEGGDAS